MSKKPPPDAFDPIASWTTFRGELEGAPFPGSVADVIAAVPVVQEFCAARASRDAGDENPFARLVAVEAFGLSAFRSVGGDVEDFADAFFARLPFDVVVGEDGTTAADEFLTLHGDRIPAALAGAVAALGDAVDVLAVTEERDGTAFLRVVGSVELLPVPADVLPPRGALFLCRLVRADGIFVPLGIALWEEAGAEDESSWPRESLRLARAARVAGEQLGVAMKKPEKGLALGAVLLDAAEVAGATDGDVPQEN